MGMLSFNSRIRQLRPHNWISLATGAIGGLVLAGWALESPLFVSGIPGLVAMNPTTAVAFMLSAISLWLLGAEQKSTAGQATGVGFAVTIAMLGIAHIISCLNSLNLGVDQLLFRERLLDNRMAPNTAVFLILLGSALLALRFSDKGSLRNLDQCLSAVLAAGALLAVIGYVLGSQSFYSIGSLMPMALNTAVLFGLMSVGVILARPYRGLLPLLLNSGPAGTVIRILVPIAVLLHPLLASLRLRGERLGFYNTEFGTSLMTAASISIFTAGILWTARLLERAEQARRDAQRDLRELNSWLSEAIEQRTEEIRQLNEELKAQVKQLADTNRSLGQKNQENEMFVYSVSHDLRSPLVNLQGFSQELSLSVDSLRSELQERGDVPAAIRTLEQDFAPSIHFIQTAVRRLSNLIDALLRLSRAGRVEYHVTNVDVNRVVNRIIDSLHATIVEKGVSIAVGQLPPICGDSAALEQVFANLIENAIRYLDPTRPGQIEVGTTVSSDPSVTTYFVADNGLGIDAQYQAKIFEAFKRVHPEICPGEGMGLAITRRIVERHEGRLWVQSVPGRGSTFFIDLPRTFEARPSNTKE